MDKEWCNENYEKSVTSHAWTYTPYDAGWEESKKYGEDLPSSSELRAIFGEEMALGTVPDWAVEIIDRMIGPLPMCGHYTFPRPLLQTCEAIKSQKCPEFVIGCYTADSERKILMSYYVYCLDAWLKNAPLEVATAELAMRDNLGKDWPKIMAAVYNTLGNPSEEKVLLLKRLVHRLRWWIKTLIWADDRRDSYLLDVYLGDVRGNAKWGTYGNAPFGDPWPSEKELPEMKELAEQINKKVPVGKKLLDRIESTWLCASKVFRYLEKLVIEIGNIGRENVLDNNASILQCKDTYPNIASHQKWYASFMSSLTEWLEGNPKALSELGNITPIEHWLVRILRHKLQLYEKYNPLKFVAAHPSGRSGTKTTKETISRRDAKNTKKEE